VSLLWFPLIEDLNPSSVRGTKSKKSTNKSILLFKISDFKPSFVSYAFQIHARKKKEALDCNPKGYHARAVKIKDFKCP